MISRASSGRSRALLPARHSALAGTSLAQAGMVALETPRINRGELVMITVSGQVASPLVGATPIRAGQDGVMRVLPGTGGIVLSHRVGDGCIGIAGDHVEPGVSIRNEGRAVKGERDGPNQALQTLACIGNRVRVLSGDAKGAVGTVTGKHGGIDTVLIDFPMPVLRRLAIGDRIQVYAEGVGLRLLDHPDVTAFNMAPDLMARWGLRSAAGLLAVPVTHRVPSALMGSGLGKSEVSRGDYDIQMFDPGSVRRHRLGSLRFGDLIAITDADHTHGRAYRRGHLAIGCVVHGESTIAGHGPGVVTLLTGPAGRLELVRDARANIAGLLGLREPAPPRERLPIAMRERRSFTHRERRMDHVHG